MATINVSLPSDGSTADVADYNTPITTIVNEINGALDNSNISASAAIATSKIATDAGLPAGALAVSSVTPEKLLTGTGTSWAWQSWTPTLSGRLNDAKWTKSCKYIQIGKTVFFRMYLLANSATPMDGGTAEAIFTLPVTSATYDVTGTSILANARFLAGGSASLGNVEWKTTTTAQFRNLVASGTYLATTVITSTAPGTWADTDAIWADGFYEAA